MGGLRRKRGRELPSSHDFCCREVVSTERERERERDEAVNNSLSLFVF
jgi:hypothetical protein